MAETHLHVDIPAAAAGVWPWLVEPERMVRWLEGLDGVALETTGPLGAGSRYRLVGRYGDRVHVMAGEVMVYAPFERFVLRLGGGAFPEGVTALADFALSALGGDAGVGGAGAWPAGGGAGAAAWGEEGDLESPAGADVPATEAAGAMAVTRVDLRIRVEGLHGLRRLAAPVAMTIARREAGLRLEILRRVVEAGGE